LQRLNELGYIEGKTIVIEYRSAEMNVELLPDAAAELVDLKVDLIVVVGTAATIAAKNATRTIPIVMMHVSDPVANGLIASLAGPGANVTGTSILQTELSPKRLELLKEAFPKLSRVAVLWTSVHPAHPLELNAIENMARRLGITVQALDITRLDGLRNAFARMIRDRPDAILTLFDARTLAYRELIAEFALKNRLPTSFASQESVEAGGFMSYGPHLGEQFRRGASYVSRIFKGAKPADLPVEQPTRFELVINLKTAKAIGVTMHQSLLFRADRVIE
jgi:putative tryptophan/tyrosine transport system substrate-binding protein